MKPRYNYKVIFDKSYKETTYKNYVKENFSYFLPASYKSNSWGEFSELEFFGENRHDFVRWLENNCQDDWCTSHYGFWFKNKNDMIKFKLALFGKIK